MASDLASLVDRITHLVDEPGEDDPDRLLERMEHTLTDGYAHALALEGESIRIERQIGRAVALIHEADSTERLPALANRLASTERELRRLRELLVALRRRTERLRRRTRSQLAC
ncbi:MAG: hypothetical protein M3327_05965 [Actinomycetota bacterium]|nr:hypothetical protein [Actinomycetota bacterium]